MHASNFPSCSLHYSFTTTVLIICMLWSLIAFVAVFLHHNRLNMLSMYVCYQCLFAFLTSFLSHHDCENSCILTMTLRVRCNTPTPGTVADICMPSMSFRVFTTFILDTQSRWKIIGFSVSSTIF